MTVHTIDQLKTALANRYRIDREIGAGGMATVYLAHDLKHERDVAIKLLHPDLGAALGGERFLSEIKTTAKLQHPHILPLLDSGEADGLLYYVMPFVTGETLRARLDREKQLPISDAVLIAREVADALQHAHAQNVIHRDIKPENILLQGGHALVADFGIALAVQQAGGARITQTGLSLGTPSYMSPEQATAEKEITARSDIYSVGCVLYEMLTGNPPHTGASAQQIIMKIITTSVDPVTVHRKSVPAHVEAAVAKSLEKLPADRFNSAKEFSDALATPGFTYATGVGKTQPNATATRSSIRHPAVAVAALFALIAIGTIGWTVFRTPAATTPVMRYDIAIGAVPLQGHDVVLSPDGTMLAYEGNIGSEVRVSETRTAIFIRRLNSDADFHKLEGTESGVTPDFSPDSKWIVFRRSRDNAIVKMSVSGGGQTTLATVPLGFNPHWGTADKILVSGPEGSYIVSANGGKPEQVKARAVGRRPFLLPDGSGILGTYGRNDILLWDFTADTGVVLIRNARHPVYVPTGHIVYVDNQGGVSAVPFDLATHRVTGSPVRVLDRVTTNVNTRGFSISNNGTFLQHEGPPTGTGNANTLLVIRSFDGKTSDTLPLYGERRVQPRFSPSGKMLAYASSPAGSPTVGNIFVYDLVNRNTTQLTFDGNNEMPSWSPDGTRILYIRDSVNQSGGTLHIKRADNSGQDEIIQHPPNEVAVNTAWPSESVLVYTSRTLGQWQTFSDIMMLSLGTKSRQSYLSTPVDEFDVAVSPDGKLTAYTSAEATVTNDIWLREFPSPIGKWKVSPAGGRYARWSADGKYLYFSKPTLRDSLYRVEVTRSPSIGVRTPVAVGDITGNAGRTPFDIHPDGKRYIYASGDNRFARDTSKAQDASRLVLITNWFAELNTLMAKANK